MISLSDLPAVNASLNATSAVLLCFGFYFIRRKQVAAHKACMLGAFGVSTLFLACYLTYHFQHPTTRFQGVGWIRVLYLTILITHSLLAMAVVPMVLVTIYRALRGRFEKHKAIARWTWPIWLYVSVTGVVVYWMLYQLYP
jgi:uncharacterized membrane protein YozB (DUF420 family)